MTTPPDEASPPHQRRPRYPGTHPRRFEQRYKELAADQYPEIVPHVLAKGLTPAGQHVPVMVNEILEVSLTRPRGQFPKGGYDGQHGREVDADEAAKRLPGVLSSASLPNRRSDGVRN
jgi:16S rRNA (cytosine1402-N4)-methyltransferase